MFILLVLIGICFSFHLQFLDMYGFSKACSGRIQDVAGLARTELPMEVADRLIRHFNALMGGFKSLNHRRKAGVSPHS